jgi:hypothetical protein
MTVQPGNRSPWECPKCCASSGAPCTYLTEHSYREGRRLVVVHRAGDPMGRMHHERPRIRCVPIGAGW